MRPDRLINMACTLHLVTPDESSSPEVDEWGDPVDSATEVETVCYAEQLRATESGTDDVGRDDWLVMFKLDETVTNLSFVDVTGVGRLHVQGAPAPFWNPRVKAFSHIEAKARRST